MRKLIRRNVVRLTSSLPVALNSQLCDTEAASVNQPLHAASSQLSDRKDKISRRHYENRLFNHHHTYIDGDVCNRGHGPNSEADTNAGHATKTDAGPGPGEYTRAAKQNRPD